MSRVDEIRKRLDDLRLHGKHGQVTWPAARAIRGFIAAAPEDCSYLLGRVEKLEGLLTRMLRSADENGINFAEGSGPRSVWSLLSEARTLLADESKENEHGNK